MRAAVFILSCIGLFCAFLSSREVKAELLAGAAIIDITPTQFPVIVNGGMVSNTATAVKTRLNARAIVLSDGDERIAIVVADSCMMPRDLLDEVKQLAATRTRIRPDRILISATHTHSAVACMGALGTDADPNYVPLLRQKLVEAIVASEANLEPAEVGWGSASAPDYTALRQWVRRPDRIALDPFGNLTVRANMHSASDPNNATGPAGPEDPELTIISLRSIKDKRPLAALTNFSMHYFSDTAVSADYFGLFSDGFQAIVKERDPDAKSFVAMMSHGCSGDIWRRDYFLPAPSPDVTIEAYSQGLLAIAAQAYSAIEYQADASLSMAEARLPMRYRVPDAQRLEWGKRVVAEMGDRLPKTDTEVYAREQMILHERQSTEIVVQAIRIGDIAIATTPCETYALTGIKLKLQSPSTKTMVIELANGGDGYIPPPEHHPLGGYNTWAARSAGLEVTAEPRVVAADLQLLEQVFAKPRREYDQVDGPTAKAYMEGAMAYWRMHDFSPPVAHERKGIFQATFEPGVLFFLEGDDTRTFTEGGVNRCVHFAGGRMRADLPKLDKQFTVRLSFWNGMPDEAREVAGWMFSRDYDSSVTSSGLHLGLGGQGPMAGRLIVQVGEGKPIIGKATVKRWTWHQVELKRTQDEIRVYLDGSKEPEIRVSIADVMQAAVPQLFFGGRSDSQDNWEGRLDEIAVYNGATD